jgi:hypothetical protein
MYYDVHKVSTKVLYMIFVSRFASDTGILPIFKTLSHIYPLFQMRKVCYICYDLRI